MTTWVGSVAVWFFESNQIENDFFFYLVTFFFFCLEAIHLWLNLVLLLLAKVLLAANFRSPFGSPSSETDKRNWNFFIGKQTDIQTVNIIFDKKTDRHRNCLHHFDKETEGHKKCLQRETDELQKCLHFLDQSQTIRNYE